MTAEASTRASPAHALKTPLTGAGRLLLVDDDHTVLKTTARVLGLHGFEVESVDCGQRALEWLEKTPFDVIVTDVCMPGVDGTDLLRSIRERDPLVQVIVMTGAPTLESAMAATNHGAFKYLLKPVSPQELTESAQRAASICRMARAESRAAALAGNVPAQTADILGFALAFERTLKLLWIAYQPILDAKSGAVVGYEALVRSNEPLLAGPQSLLGAAERLGRLPDLGRSIRALAGAPLPGAASESLLFVNLHAEDLLDEMLFEANPLADAAHRVVLEITERASLEKVPDVAQRVARLRKAGFRIAVDDLGAGYSGLASFTHLEPEFVKLDLSLVRGVHQNPTQRRVVGAITSLAKDLDMQVVAEGVETLGESTTLRDLGCDLVQGYLYAQPGRAFPGVVWPHER